MAVRPSPLRALLLTALVFLAMAAALPGNFADPYVSFDDYPTLFGWTGTYYSKTLTEGRWVNYLWQEVVGPLDRRLAFWLVAAMWSGVAAIMATAFFAEDRRPWRAALFALALGFAPQFAAISPWHNTLVPCFAVLLAYVALAAWAPPRVAAGALMVFVPLGLMSYTTFPLIMLLACVLSGDWRGWRRGAALVAVFGASLVLGLLAIYALNWRYHGVFGMELDAWRNPHPAKTLAEVAANMVLALDRMRLDLVASFLSTPRVGALIYAAAVGMALALAPRRAIPVLGVLAIGVAMVLYQAVTTGIVVDFRAWAFAWAALAALVAVLSREAETRGRRIVFAAVLPLLALSGAHNFRVQYGLWTPFRDMTADLGAEIDRAKAPAGEPILVYGAPHALTQSRYIHSLDKARDWTLAFRLYSLTGRETCICGEKLSDDPGAYCAKIADICAANAPRAASLGAWPSPEAFSAPADGPAVLRFAK